MFPDVFIFSISVFAFFDVSSSVQTLTLEGLIISNLVYVIFEGLSISNLVYMDVILEGLNIILVI